MKTVLIVDDDTAILDLLESKLNSLLCSVKVLRAQSYKESIKHILNKQNSIDAAIVDLYLPDVKDAAVVDFAIKKDIPTLVLVDDEDIQSKKSLIDKSIVDYVRKGSEKNFNYAVKSVSRILKNYDTNILIVDDSPLQLKTAVDMIKKMKLDITTAMDGKEALSIIENSNKKFSLVLTDYNMPEMDGMELTIKIRERYDKDELGIIVLSINDSPHIPTQFLRMGANDFINKPFTSLEVNTRINANLEILDLFQKTRDMANKDFLTGAFNRRYFFDSGQAIYAKSKRKGTNLVVAMLDIDKFKNINDQYGHDIGDLAIKRTVEIIKNNLRTSDLME
jgi:PleD family two-component response regulator